MKSHPRKIENAGNTPRQKTKPWHHKEEICWKKRWKGWEPAFKNIKTCKATLQKYQNLQSHTCEFFDRAPRAGIDTDNIAGLRRTSPTITPTTTITTTTDTDEPLTQTCDWHRRTLLLSFSLSLSVSLSLSLSLAFSLSLSLSLLLSLFVVRGWSS